MTGGGRRSGRTWLRHLATFLGARASWAAGVGGWGANLGPSHPDLSPHRGTNPFATVKLRPTVTNDRSAPLIR